MPLTSEEKERIKEEERLRLEVRPKQDKATTTLLGCGLLAGIIAMIIAMGAIIFFALVFLRIIKF